MSFVFLLESLDLENPFKNLQVNEHSKPSLLFHWLAKTPPPLAIIRGRDEHPKYRFPPPTSPIDVQAAMEDLKQRTHHLSNPSPECSILTEDELDIILLHTFDKPHLRNLFKSNHDNPFPGIDLNKGWNRARYTVQHYFDILGAFEKKVFDEAQEHLKKGLPWDMAKKYNERADTQGLPEDRVKIMEGMNAFSFRKQNLPLLLEPKDVEAMGFGLVFQGVGYNTGRIPGQWWAARKHVFAEFQGKNFYDEVECCSQDIHSGVWRYQAEQYHRPPVANPRKREARTRWIGLQQRGGGAKRRRVRGEDRGQVMSEAWRKRRRGQEKKAGRWLDGTVRMIPIWGEFYWAYPDWPKQGEVDGT